MIRTPLSLETLEGRLAPATFGIPWPAAERLTLSFTPDGTPLAGHTSELFRALEAIAETPVWQHEILRAFQTWAVHANINVGVRADGGEPFGVAGRPYADPRFGDVRLGAHRMSRDALATSVPFAPVFSGTLTGDVFLNSGANFTRGSLFATMLHEAGHVFGLGHSDDPTSPMYAHLNALARLTAGDVAALQALYGARAADRHEGPQGNELLRTATLVRHPRHYDGFAPLVVFGDVTTRADVDVFALRLPNGYRGPVTVRLQTEEVSLLAPRLTVLDAAGRMLGQAESSLEPGSVVSVRLDEMDPAAGYFVRVEAAVGDEFGVGAYGLAISHDAVQQVSVDALDRFLRGPHQEFTPDEIDELFRNPAGAFVGDDRRGNDSFASAVFLRQRPGSGTVFDVVASLSDAADVDYYRVVTAPGRAGRRSVLAVTAWGITDNAVVPRVSVFAPNRAPVPAEVLVNGNGTFAIEVVGNHPEGFYYLRLSAPAGAEDRLGNYTLHALFSARAADLETFADGGLDESLPAQSHDLYVGRSQLFQFVLSAQAAGAPAGAAVRMSVFDSSCREVFWLDAAAGDSVSGPGVFLTPGAYTVSFSSLDAAPALTYRLRGRGLTDPIGPALEDPTLLPMYQAPFDPTLYIYPGNIRSSDPYLWVALV